MHETTQSSLRNDALGLDLRVQQKLFETSPIQTLKNKRNFGEMMTTHRYEDVMEPSYTPRTTRSDRELAYLPSREEICAAKRIDTELCSSNLVFGAPEEGEEEALQEPQHRRFIQPQKIHRHGEFTRLRTGIAKTLAT